MVNCDNCGSEVPEVWRHRQFGETMTHHSITWVCRSCHPSVAETVATEPTDTGVVVTDGGTPTLACPACGGATIGGQGLFDCQECTWSGEV